MPPFFILGIIINYFSISVNDFSKLNVSKNVRFYTIFVSSYYNINQKEGYPKRDSLFVSFRYGFVCGNEYAKDDALLHHSVRQAIPDKVPVHQDFHASCE